MAYNYYITIQQSSVTADDYGERDKTWTTYKSCWAEMDVPGGTVSNESDMPVYSDSRIFRIRTHDAPSVTSKMRVAYTENSTTDYFYINSINKEGRMFTVLNVVAFDDE